jgi:hypothetical protein
VIVDIPKLDVTTPTGTVECRRADVSIAVSDSVAMRVVPLGPDGTAYPDDAKAVLIPGDGRDNERDPQMRQFLAAVQVAARNILRDKVR